MIEELIRIADTLDALGFYKEASEVDEALKAKWESMQGAPIPGSFQNTYSWADAIKSIREHIVLALNSGAIDRNSVVAVEKILSEVSQEAKVRETPGAGAKERVSAADLAYYIPPKAVEVAENIANLLNDIRQAQETLKTKQDDNLERELENDTVKLKQNVQMLDSFIEPEHREAVEEYVASKTTDRSKNVVLIPERRGEGRG